MKRWPRYIVRMKKKQDTKQIHVCSVASVVYDSFRPYGLVAHQAPLSMGFYRLEYWSRLSCPPPGDLPNPGIEPRSLVLQAYSLPSEPPGKPKKTVVGSLFLLQGIFSIQKLNQGLPALQADFLPAEQPRKPSEMTDSKQSLRRSLS